MSQKSHLHDDLNTQPITGWLHAAREGDDSALSELFEAVYPVLHKMASNKPGVIRDGALTPTALVNELYLKVVGSSAFNAEDRKHFYVICSHAMRNIVIDFARAAMSQKRGGDYQHCAFTNALASQPDRSQELLDLHTALNELDKVNSRLRELIELRFFGGLTHKEVAELQSRSERSIRRDWVKARAFLVARAKPVTNLEPE